MDITSNCGCQGYTVIVKGWWQRLGWSNTVLLFEASCVTTAIDTLKGNRYLEIVVGRNITFWKISWP